MNKKSPSPLTDAKAERWLAPIAMRLYALLRESPWRQSPYEALQNVLRIQQSILERHHK